MGRRPSRDLRRLPPPLSGPKFAYFAGGARGHHRGAGGGGRGHAGLPQLTRLPGTVVGGTR